MSNLSNENMAQKVSIGPVPAWVSSRSVDFGFKPNELGHLTILLSDSQNHAETRQHYHRTVQRLETMRAVQDVAQFKLDFDPSTEQIVVHSVSVKRGERWVEQAAMDRFHFLQREQSLEVWIVHGWATLLLLLEDVQIGDVIDASYTITRCPKLLPGRFSVLHTIPLGIPIKVAHFDVRFSKTRPMQWKSSASDLSPQVHEVEAEIRWEWKRENLLEAVPEPNLPNWFLVGTWIQVTDCKSWEEIVDACLKSWPLDEHKNAVQQLADAIKAETQTEEERIDKALTYVQDEFRYLSVNLAFGGQIPSPADDVLRRRFGDCKDLSCLAAALLRSLGISARPVLVNTMLTKRIRDLLPMPGVFNHAVVQYEITNEKRCVDATRRLQGGLARNRPVTDFGYGLSIESGIKELQAMPRRAELDGTYRLKESFWLNSAGPWSVLEVFVTGTGAEAENLRNWFANAPEKLIAEEREQFYAQVYPQVKRLGRIAHKDNRRTNEFALAEIYEVAGALRPTYGGLCYFPFQSHLVQRVFRQPLTDTRKNPCALPYPFNIEHVIEFDFPGPFRATPPYLKTHPLFRCERKTRAAQGFHTVTFSLQTFSDCILPEQFADFRKMIDEIWAETSLFIELPIGVQGRRPKHREAKL